MDSLLSQIFRTVRPKSIALPENIYYLDGHRDAHGLGVVPLPGPALGAVVGVAPLDHLLLEERGVLDHGLGLDVDAAGLHLGGVVGGLALGGLDGGAEGLLGDLVHLDLLLLAGLAQPGGAQLGVGAPLLELAHLLVVRLVLGLRVVLGGLGVRGVLVRVGRGRVGLVVRLRGRVLRVLGVLGGLLVGIGRRVAGGVGLVRLVVGLCFGLCLRDGLGLGLGVGLGVGGRVGVAEDAHRREGE